MRIAIAIVTLCTLCQLAHGQVETLVIDKSRVPVGTTVLEVGITEADDLVGAASIPGQFVLTRFYNNTDHPSGQLIGWGPASIIAATPVTKDISGSSGRKAIVVTEGNEIEPEEDISEWQNGGTTHPAVLQPTFANHTVIGYIANYDWTQEGDVNDQPRLYNQGDPDLYGGYDLFGNGGIVYNVGFFGIPGTACKIVRRGSNRSGFQLEHDRLRWKVDRCYARRCFRGFELTATDMTAGDIEVEAVRDWGVKMDSSVQFGIIHVYGCGYSGAPGGGAAMWIIGQQNLGGPVYLENAEIGLNDSGQYTTINGITSHTCANTNILAAGQHGKYFGVDLRRAPVNVKMDGSANSIHGGVIELAESGVGIQYNDGTIVDSSNISNNVRDIWITGYGDKDGDGDINGQPSEGGGAAVDEQDADNAIGIDVNTAIKRVNITGVTIQECTKGIDFSGGGSIANDGSVIWIQTSNVTTPVTWPDGQTWNTTPNGAETRDIRINGVRYYQN